MQKYKSLIFASLTKLARFVQQLMMGCRILNGKDKKLSVIDGNQAMHKNHL